MQTLPILFFKTCNSTEPVYQRSLHKSQSEVPVTGTGSAASISFRNLNLQKDIPMLHEWVNHPHSEKFWQLKGYTEAMLYTLYEGLTANPGYHALIGYYNDKSVCEVDVYRIKGSEIFPFIPNASDKDCGVHFLMAPPRESFKGLSLLMLRAFMEMYFSFPFAGDLYAEPSELNALANLLAKKAGFTLLRKANLQNKIANLYKITKEQFVSQVPLHTVSS